MVSIFFKCALKEKKACVATFNVFFSVFKDKWCVLTLYQAYFYIERHKIDHCSDKF